MCLSALGHHSENENVMKVLVKPGSQNFSLNCHFFSKFRCRMLIIELFTANLVSYFGHKLLKLSYIFFCAFILKLNFGL